MLSLKAASRGTAVCPRAVYTSRLRFLSEKTPTYSVADQLRRVKQLCDIVSGTNVKTEKARIISGFPDLRPLLEKVYDPKYRSHMSWKVLQKYTPDELDITSSSSANQSILELLEMLGEKILTGNEAKRHVHVWLNSNVGSEEDAVMLQETFGRLLDRNLLSGFGTNTLGIVPWPKPTVSTPVSSPPKTPSRATTSKTPSTSREGNTGPASSSKSPSSTPATSTSKGSYRLHSPITLRKHSVALGKSITPPFTELFTPPTSSKPAPPRWFASRKLDGIRVITLIDIYVPHDTSQQLSIHHIRFGSRAANEFTSLDKLKSEVEGIVAFPNMREWLDRDDLILSETDEGVVKRIILDGEVCVMRPVSGIGYQSRVMAIGDDGSGASALWADDGLVEDFHAAVSQIRKSGTVERPVYFVFDLLSFAEFDAQKAVKGAGGLGKSFGERAGEAKELVDWLYRDESGNRRVKVLVQKEVKEAEEVDKMVERATNEGWEGLIFRADTPYHGNRSNDIRKFKEWHDFEAKVESMDTRTMRLAVDGIFGEYEACTNVWVKFKGHPVSIGTGFSADERIQYAEDPSLIVGKEITVEYFSESKAVGRDETISSLRFPRIKKVWGDKRDV